MHARAASAQRTALQHHVLVRPCIIGVFGVGSLAATTVVEPDGGLGLGPVALREARGGPRRNGR